MVPSFHMGDNDKHGFLKGNRQVFKFTVVVSFLSRYFSSFTELARPSSSASLSFCNSPMNDKIHQTRAEIYPTDLWQVMKQVHHLSQHRITCPLPPANCRPATPRRTNPIPSAPRHCDVFPDRTSLCSSPGSCSDVQFSETIFISRYLFGSGGLRSFVVSSVYFCTLCHEDQRRNSVSALISLTKILGTLLQAV